MERRLNLSVIPLFSLMLVLFSFYVCLMGVPRASINSIRADSHGELSMILT